MLKSGSFDEFGNDACAGNQGSVPEALPRARVGSFVADVVLTPKSSVGTVTPDSIYEARFVGKIAASRPGGAVAAGGVTGECELELPLPPQIISLADLSIATEDGPREQVTLRDGRLVWRGELPAEQTTLDVTDTATGKGLYELSLAPGGLVDEYRVSLTAKGRMCGSWSCRCSRRASSGRAGAARIAGIMRGRCLGGRCGSTCWALRRSIGWAS